MTTLIQVIAAGRTRKCTALCYDGSRTNCQCVCGGQFHGVGILKAQNKLAAIVFKIPSSVMGVTQEKSPGQTSIFESQENQKKVGVAR